MSGMREAQLRDVLLVKALEETPGMEALISESDRRAATREARRNVGDAANADLENRASGLSRRAQRMLAVRAELLLTPLARSHPFIGKLSQFAQSSALLRWALIVASAVFGGALSMLDGTKHIDLLSLPTFGLIAWNLLVYAAIAAGALRSRERKRVRGAFLPGLVAASVLRKVRRFVTASGDYSAALAEALDRFVREWLEVSRPLLLARATRLFHLCAAAAGVGLICALYLRSLTIDYSAGWESTFLDPADVYRLVSIVYGPASAVTGIPVPDASHLAAIRWENGGGGERAAYWIHLLAASVALFIVAPRLALAALSTLSIWRRASNATLPMSLGAYFAETFGAAAGPDAVTVVPYGYEPTEAALDELRRRLVAAAGGGTAFVFVAPVGYGDESELLRDVAHDRQGELLILLLNLAATPEEENHGSAIDRVLRSGAAAGPRKALVVIDEQPYAARMLAQGGAAERMTERRRLWAEFVERRGAVACFIDLVSESAGHPADADVERLRKALLQV
jgi:hypothetical protein